MSASTGKPPTIHDLLADSSFKAMMKSIPDIPESLAFGNPWQLWGVTHDGKWRTAQYPEYRAVWAKAVTMIRNRDEYRDVAIVSKRIFMPPPAGFNILDHTTLSSSRQWCSRCRRPSVFKNWHETHHALRRQPVLTDDSPFRCYYCGIRKVALPSIMLAGLR